ncbi:uncharacterized protein C1orf131 homolog isoform X2 [Kryptolebias marmoratus]|uniref:Zgc:194224 n=2 Tax=Kryptolebias marmoratus TaxID=37003 RepID=A0A3Q3BBG3_KRYMA|nr:uncharacterized protein C1orf131 homolog isoform X2 [Kryptolebias marmoratus]
MSSGGDGKEDEDCLFLERVLDSLYDFGSELKRTSQKKKKRKRHEEEEELPSVEDVCGDDEDCEGAGVHVGAEHQPQTEHEGPTIQQVEVVTFQDPRKKPKPKETPASNKMPALQMSEQQQSSRQEELSLEKARLDVHRFGLTGYKKEQQRVFEQDRAVMLGARPPKKDYVNYKALQQRIKEKKQKEKEEFQPDKKKKKKRKSNQRDKKKPSSSGSGSGSGSAPSGQVGRFKNGMLLLSSKEIQKIKSHK